MKYTIMAICLLTGSITFGECIKELEISGFELLQKSYKFKTAHIETSDNKFVKLTDLNINSIQLYKVQIPEHKFLGDFSRYNRKYIEYYRYSRMGKFLAENNNKFQNLGYETTIVGKSIENRNLYALKPTSFDPNKKTIVMFGRHHGDEGTANWIIEGFINKFLKANETFHTEFQLILYPMVNPDGAEAQSRYNENGRDLNRSWSFDVAKSYDEAKIIHKDLKPYLKNRKNIVAVLDMHGSFSEDFIYRVEDDFINRDFYNHQQNFIDQLARYDLWQGGNYKLSNGHPKMARIVMVKNYGLHALTHETPRDIKKNNSKGRNKTSLMQQGEAVFDVLNDLY